MKIVYAQKPQLWVPPTQIFEYFGLNRAEETMEAPKVELWSVAKILSEYKADPGKWSVDIPAANGIPRHLEDFQPDQHVKWHWDVDYGRGTNGVNGVTTHAAKVRLNPDGSHTFLYDMYHRTNGKPTGQFSNDIEIGTPGAHTAVVIYDQQSGQWFEGFFFVYRPDMVWEGQMGAWIAGVPGGYGLGDATKQAIEELREYGLETIEQYLYLGHTNPDRDQWGDPDQLGAAVFRIEDVRDLENDDHEVILKSRFLTPIEHYPNQLDMYDSQAVSWTREAIRRGLLKP